MPDLHFTVGVRDSILLLGVAFNLGALLSNIWRSWRDVTQVKTDIRDLYMKMQLHGERLANLEGRGQGRHDQ